MSNFEYKTVALSRTVNQRRKRRQSEADLVAEQLGRVLNEEAVEGWEYVRAETLTTPGQRGLLKQQGPAAYVVLIFKRARGNPAMRQEKWTEQQRPAQSANEELLATAQESPLGDVKIGATSVQLVSNAEPPRSVTPMRPPLGSAQD